MKNPILMTTAYDFRLMRGGSWDDSSKIADVSHHHLYEEPDFDLFILPGDYVYGFRIFRSLK